MIICEKHTNPPTISNNIISTSCFSIKESSGAFQILSSSLYKNKIRAIIRELSCNSRDAMIAAGKEQSFYCHLPTKMEPEFYVRDQGIGLSHDDVMSLYTTYFESTKSTSNMFIGALGLGSKSPFSYTENFTVTSIKDGIRGIYSAYINDSGMPSIVQMFSETTSEQNGVEVKMAVAVSDHETFRKEASCIFQWFDVQPITNIPLYPAVITPKIFTYHKEIFGKDSIVVMGGVAYHFDILDFVPDEIKINLLLNFNIGAVDVLPSREGLQNTKKTKDAILLEFNRIKNDIKKSALADLDSIPSYYDRVCKLKLYKPSILEAHVCNKIYSSEYSDYGLLTFENLSDFYLVGKTYSDSIGKKTPKMFNNDIISVGHIPTIFIYNDSNFSIKFIKENTLPSQRVLIFTPLNKKLPVDFDSFQKNVLFGAKVLMTSDFKNKPDKSKASQVKNKNPNGLLIASKNKLVMGCRNKKSFKFLVPDQFFDKTQFKFFVKLNVDNKIFINNRIISLESVINLVGISTIIFLKKNSKFDTEGLVDIIDHIDSEIKKLVPLKLPSLKYESFQFVNALKHIDIKFDDDELNTVISTFKNSNSSESDEKIEYFMLQNMYIDTRDKFDENRIFNLFEKYDAVNLSTESKGLIKLLINTIHNNTF